MRSGHPQKTFGLMKNEWWAPLWFDADSKKCQIQMVEMTKKPGTLLLLYTLSTQGTISLGQAVALYFDGQVLFLSDVNISYLDWLQSPKRIDFQDYTVCTEGPLQLLTLFWTDECNKINCVI